MYFSFVGTFLCIVRIFLVTVWFLFIHSPNFLNLQSRPSFLKSGPFFVQLVPSFIYCLPFYFLVGIFKTPKNKPPYFQWVPFYFETSHCFLLKALYSFCQLNMFHTKTYINEGFFKSMSLQTNWTLVKTKWQFAQLVVQLQWVCTINHLISVDTN